MPLPFTDLEGLLQYCRSNEVDVLFLQHRLLPTYPFLRELVAADATPGLTRIYRTIDSTGEPVELYRLQ